MERPVPRLTGLLLLWVCALPLFSAPLTSPMSVGWTQSGEQWRSWETEHFRIHALARHQHWVEHLAREAEAAHQELSQTLGWSPRSRTDLVLSDDHDFSNGWAAVFPFNQSRLYLSPPDRFNSLEAYDDWLRVLIRHEYTHVLHLDQAEGLPGTLQRVFGRMPLLFPHQFQPLWMIEGIAMQAETDETAGAGRGQSALMATRMRAELADGSADSLSEVTGLNRRWPAGQGYLYGVFFIEFLEETRGEDAVERWLRDYRNNLIPFWMNPTARQSFGEPFPELWQDYQSWLEERFETEAAPSEAGRPVTDHGLQDEPPVARGEAVYRIHRDGHGPARLVRYTDDDHEVLTRVEYPGLMDVDEQGRVLVAGQSSRKDNRVLSDLYLWQPQQGWQRLTHGERYREARWLDEETIVARRIVDGQVELDRLDADGRFRDRLWQGRPGDVMGPFAVAPDGEYLVAAFKSDGRSGWRLRAFDPSSRDWETLTDNGQIQGQPAFSPDGDWLLFSADYSDTYDLYRLRLADGQKERLTRSVSGAFSPVQTDDGAIWYQRYSSDGFDLYHLSESEQLSAPVPDTEPVRDPEPEAEAVTLTPKGRYRPAERLAPTWWFPFVAADDDTTQIGLTTSGQDALGRHAWNLLIGRDGTSSNAFGTFQYQYDNRLALTLSRGVDFFTDDGETVRARSDDTISLRFLNLYNALHDHLALDAGLFHERNADLWRESGQPPAPSVRRALVGLGLRFDNSDRYWYSISPASGRRMTLTAETHDALPGDFEGELFQADWQEYVHLGRSHVLRLRGAVAWGDPGVSPLRLGGETEDGRLFGRDRYPLRGYDRNDLPGTRLGLASAEWRMPLWRIGRNWQVWPIGARDLHGRVFTDAGRLWRASNPELEGETYVGVGAELTLETVLGYRALVPVTVGYGHGLDDELGRDRFWIRAGVNF